MDNNFTNAQRAEVLVQAMPNIRRYYKKIIVIKYGGNAMINEDLKQQVMQDIVLLSLIGTRVVLVHGGGPEISDLMKRLGKEAVFIDGLRVTDKETVDIAQMVLAGKINKSLVNMVEHYGGNAIGLSGIDGHRRKSRTSGWDMSATSPASTHSRSWICWMTGIFRSLPHWVVMTRAILIISTVIPPRLISPVPCRPNVF